ncbi:uncharacterized protein LOC116286371 [Actinia tenebrosa]|uniref:Uncharacterized protein LOC116286371 n=1 Tax=Actinia tenebrosa TaxID=6105 RepID=A0A6P8H031_ACTTE|nr:uncharacterized protein LOC116286371 [Actinia tenebrosa]XP_031548737.1 uncharacterized protein LOC116286371 [Actinia tenebrosa]
MESARMANFDAKHSYPPDLSESSNDNNALFMCLLAMSVVCIIQLLICVLFAYKGCKAKFSPEPPPYSPWSPFLTLRQSQQASDFNEPPPAYVTVQNELRDINEPCLASQGLDNEENDRQCDVEGVTPTSTLQDMNEEESNEKIRDTTNGTHEELSTVSQVTNNETSQGLDNEESNRQCDVDSVTPGDSS